MSDMYAVESRLTKMCMEMVDSLTNAKNDIDKIDKSNLDSITLLLGFQSLARAVEAMMSLIQNELHKDDDILLIDNK